MRFATLDEWLEWQLTLNPTEIRLGLDRVGAVWKKIHPAPITAQVITVSGTNGKGSSVAFLREILTASGYRVGCYTSPHLSRYNERILVDGQEAADGAICGAFEVIDQMRGEIPLTYFEFGTLVALLLFCKADLDVIILEVGLGGRLDAVNIIDADVALITTIDLDHMDWLGNTRETIGYEKAGIMRPGRPAIFAGENVPDSVLRHAREIGCPLFLAGRDFSFSSTEQSWEWQAGSSKRHSLPLPTLRGRFQLNNAAAVLMVLEQVKNRLPVDQQGVRSGLLSAKVPGRFELVGKEPVVILDVAHNPEAARALSANLGDMYCAGESVAVFSMLGDKDIDQVVATMSGVVDRWHICPLSTQRAAGIEELQTSLQRSGISPGKISVFPDCVAALAAARDCAGPQGRVVAFGSVYLVGAVRGLL